MIVTSTGSATAAPAIEGLWTFNGGTVIVAAGENAQLIGTVASPTTLETCVHPVGQAMWTNLVASGDGMYTGSAVWYHGSGSDCRIVPERGRTAFRVLTQTNGSTLLRVCFNQPGSTATPYIAPDGTATGVNYGCIDSAPVAPLPATGPSFDTSIILPATGRHVCLSRRHFVIHIREPKHDPFVKLTVYLGSRIFKVIRHGDAIAARIDLRGLPRGTYTIHIRARTAAGFVVKGRRTYHTCVPKI
jgi:hypothetical protein